MGFYEYNWPLFEVKKARPSEVDGLAFLSDMVDLNSNLTFKVK